MNGRARLRGVPSPRTQAPSPARNPSKKLYSDFRRAHPARRRIRTCGRNAAAICIACALFAPGAGALEVGPVGGEPVLVEVTNASSVFYNVDNRDGGQGRVASYANDDWGALYNRLNASAGAGRFRLSLRVDQAWFFASPDPADIATRAVEGVPAADVDALYRRKVSEAGIELSNRYLDWVYPAKYSLAYGTPDFEVVLGDDYAELGRGLVLSVRKADELASDTTVRGLRVGGRMRFGDTRLRLTALGGTLNPLRVDEASGRHLGVHESVTPGLVALAEAGMPRAQSTDFVPSAERCASFGTCSYAPDRVLGAQAQIAVPGLTLGTQGSLLVRQDALSDDVVRTADRVLTASQSVELLALANRGSLYVEAALQRLEHDGASEPELDPGHAVYVAASYVDPAYSVLFEGKHYRRFFPLAANVSLSRAREFSALQYSAPPTTEATWNDTELEGFNTCVSGGRVRGEARLARAKSLYAWVGHYRTFAESVTNEHCTIASENENRVWDTAIGLDLASADRATRADVSLGSRFDDAERELVGAGGATRVFYRELSLRYEANAPLGGPWALELHGVHRRRRQTVGGPVDAWLEGEHTTGIEWGARASAGFGVEYDGRPDVPGSYLNAQFAYHPTEELTLGLFVGQRRGSLRCVGGVCRVYPPFEGGRLDATLRF